MKSPYFEIECMSKAMSAIISAQSASTNKRRVKKLEKMFEQLREMMNEIRETTGAEIYEPEFVKQPQVSELSQSFIKELALCR